ncbi:MAG TPA: sugar phosphate nucleotidyltransferase [Candidatus Saccharimonadales bacterium]|nr:sugar phosphate nucleotidyltransferase [Candidatus Saccharimonadales bacterium]
MRITKAIIPVAGWGTRRLPITKSIEKCMLPIGNRPIVDYVVQDCIAAGIKDIYFIVSENSSQLQAYYEENTLLNDYLVANNKADKLSLVTPPPSVSFHYIAQPMKGKYGTAIPVSLAAPYLDEGESVVVLMGDDFIFNTDGTSEVSRLLDAAESSGSSMMGVAVPKENVSRYGVIELNENNEFMRIVEKPAVEEAPSNLINVSKYVLNYEILKMIIAYTHEEVDGEYYITDPINRYVLQGGALRVVPARGKYLDGGSVEGWLYANKVVLEDVN